MCDFAYVKVRCSEKSILGNPWKLRVGEWWGYVFFWNVSSTMQEVMVRAQKLVKKKRTTLLYTEFILRTTCSFYLLLFFFTNIIVPLCRTFARHATVWNNSQSRMRILVCAYRLQTIANSDSSWIHLHRHEYWISIVKSIVRDVVECVRLCKWKFNKSNASNNTQFYLLCLCESLWSIEANPVGGRSLRSVTASTKNSTLSKYA